MWEDGSLVLVGRGGQARLCVAQDNEIWRYEDDLKPHGNSTVLLLAKPGELTKPRIAAEWVAACGGSVKNFIHHKAWKRFLHLLSENQSSEAWFVDVLNEDGLFFEGYPKLDTPLRLRAPSPPRQLAQWSIYDPFSRRFRFWDAAPEAQLGLHEQLERELMTRGPVLIALKGRFNHKGEHNALSDAALTFARTLLGAYARRRGGLGLEELVLSDHTSWSVTPSDNVIKLVAFDPSVPGVETSIERLSASTRWSCTLIETPPTNERDWLDWLRILSGTPWTGARLRPNTGRISDAQLIRQALMRLDEATILASHRQPTAKAGGRESEEHLGCKAAVLGRLQDEKLDGQRVLVEHNLKSDSDDHSDEYVVDATSHARVDLALVADEQECRFVEVETFRWSKDQDPFARVLRRLVNKADLLQRADTIELIAPPAVAALAPRPVCRVAESLRAYLPNDNLKVGTVDLGDGDLIPVVSGEVTRPVFSCTPQEPAQSALSNRSTTENLMWSGIAGYERLKQFLRDDVESTIKRAEELEAEGFSLPGGVLLFGPPGTGKSRIARALAGELNRQARIMRPSDFISKWLGEGVERIRAHADWAVRHKPSVLIIDELDAIAPSRSDKTSSVHQDTLAMVNELLTQLDRLKLEPEVFVVATTNAMDRIDSAVMRAGRFEFKLPVGPPNAADRASLLRHYLRHHVESVPDQKLSRWVDNTELMAAADISGIVELAGRRKVIKADRRAVDVLVDEAINEWSPPSLSALSHFISDTKRFASPAWHSEYQWLMEHECLKSLLQP